MRKQYVSLHDIHVDLRHMTAYEAIKRIHELAGDELLKEYSDDTLRARLTMTEQALEAARSVLVRSVPDCTVTGVCKNYGDVILHAQDCEYTEKKKVYSAALARLEEVTK